MMKQSNENPRRMIIMSRDFTGLSRRTVQRMTRKVKKTYKRDDFIAIKIPLRKFS